MYGSTTIFNGLIPDSAQGDIASVAIAFINADWGVIVLVVGTLLAGTLVVMIARASSGK